MIPIDTISTIYKELFTINFTHSGYGTGIPVYIADEIKLAPDTATKILCRNYHIGYQFSNAIFVCFIRVNALPKLADGTIPYIPYIHVADNLKLRFLLKASGTFMNKTVIEEAGATQVYHFSNRVNAGSGMFISYDAAAVNNNDLANVAIIQPEENCLGVIDISSSQAINAEYEFFSSPAPQVLQGPSYKISFTSKI